MRSRALMRRDLVANAQDFIELRAQQLFILEQILDVGFGDHCPSGASPEAGSSRMVTDLTTNGTSVGFFTRKSTITMDAFGLRRQHAGVKNCSGELQMIALGADHQACPRPAPHDGEPGDQKNPELFAHEF